MIKTSISHITILTLTVLMLNGCDESERYESQKKELIAVDVEFSRQSKLKGSHSAFLEYIDDSCVLLRPNRNPVIGREKVEEMFSSPDTSFSLTWDVLYADVSQSGDLGYTYGIYKIEMDSPEGNSVTKEGTYVTIWKKDSEGKWKFVLDTGNLGLGKKNGECK